MKEKILTLQIKPNKAEITSDDIFDSIFYRYRASKTGAKDEKHYGSIAKEIVKLAARKKVHLLDSQYNEMMKKFNISMGEYYNILRKLKIAGWIRKDGHTFKAIRKFARGQRKRARAAEDFCEDLNHLFFRYCKLLGQHYRLFQKATYFLVMGLLFLMLITLTFIVFG